jgi:ABC-2 type transport system permease protein
VRIAVERLVGMVAIVAWVTLVSTLALALISPAIGLDEGLPWWALWSAGLQSYLFALVLSALSFAVGAVTGSRGLAIAVGSAVAVLGFLLQALSSIAEILETARWASPWYWLLRDNPVVTGPNALNTVLPVALSVAFAVLGVAVFQRRDLHLA